MHFSRTSAASPLIKYRALIKYQAMFLMYEGFLNGQVALRAFPRRTDYVVTTRPSTWHHCQRLWKVRAADNGSVLVSDGINQCCVVCLQETFIEHP